MGNGEIPSGGGRVGNRQDGAAIPEGGEVSSSGEGRDEVFRGQGGAAEAAAAHGESRVEDRALYSASDWGRAAGIETRETTGPEEYRHPIRRDYARIIHSPAFRRLQGKTQLFPGHESDFFRNRLTHSLEVAQIGESIARRFNATIPYFQRNELVPALVAAAGLVHDLGHPPFGHNGEKALDDCMKHSGGFEGNAQTLRILTRLEKKQTSDGSLSPISGGQDVRVGLNLSYRMIAAALKYDREIPNFRSPDSELVKGYYETERPIVEHVKDAVAPRWRERGRDVKTIECSIMDLADDIAYSTYDLEDSLKAGFLSPALILASDVELLHRVATAVSKATGQSITGDDVLTTFAQIFGMDEGNGDASSSELLKEAFRASKQFTDSGYVRTSLTSDLVSEFIAGVDVDIDDEFPMLSSAKFQPETHVKVEILKRYTFEATILSSRLKVAEYRGGEIVSGIFQALDEGRGEALLPDDVKMLHRHFVGSDVTRRRCICDFVAGMTDRYAVEFYARLHSDTAQSMFKPF